MWFNLLIVGLFGLLVLVVMSGLVGLLMVDDVLQFVFECSVILFVFVVEVQECLLCNWFVVVVVLVMFDDVIIECSVVDVEDNICGIDIVWKCYVVGFMGDEQKCLFQQFVDDCCVFVIEGLLLVVVVLKKCDIELVNCLVVQVLRLKYMVVGVDIQVFM